MQLTRHGASADPDVVLKRPMPPALAWGIVIGGLAVIFAVDRATALAPVQHLYYLAGAEAVRTVGRLLAEGIPNGAVACRYGGDEFVVALPGCDEARARAIADDLRGAVNGCAPALAGVPFPAGTLSMSVGIACRSFEGRRLSKAPALDDAAGEELFRAADAALYAAKAGGRNRVALSAGPA
jgi:diguanylate cyclase (GGDEF)-like protein